MKRFTSMVIAGLVVAALGGVAFAQTAASGGVGRQFGTMMTGGGSMMGDDTWGAAKGGSGLAGKKMPMRGGQGQIGQGMNTEQGSMPMGGGQAGSGNIQGEAAAK